MNKKDKDKILIILFVLAYIAICVVMCIGTSKIPWQYIIGLALCTEYFLIQPKICQLYYKANGMNAGYDRYIPFWNDVMILEGSTAIAALISYVILALSFCAFIIPAETIGNIFGEAIMLNFGVYTIRFCAIALVINSIIIGFGFCQVSLKIKRMHTELVGATSHYYFLNPLLYVLLVFPVVRTVALVCVYNVLNKLVSFNGFNVNNVETNSIFVEEDN